MLLLDVCSPCKIDISSAYKVKPSLGILLSLWGKATMATVKNMRERTEPLQDSHSVCFQFAVVRAAAYQECPPFERALNEVERPADDVESASFSGD